MQTIDENALESDPAYRFRYVAEFVGFSPADMDAIKEASEKLTPLVPKIVESFFERSGRLADLWKPMERPLDDHAGHSLRRSESLSTDQAIVLHRKSLLTAWLLSLLSGSYDAETALDLIRISTSDFDHDPSRLSQINALMGCVSDDVFLIVRNLGLPHEKEIRTTLAFQKVFWIQMNLAARKDSA